MTDREDALLLDHALERAVKFNVLTAADVELLRGGIASGAASIEEVIDAYVEHGDVTYAEGEAHEAENAEWNRRRFAANKCDGCGRENRIAAGSEDEGEDEDEYGDDFELTTCPDCFWSVCDDCGCNPRRGVCRCLNSDMGNAYCDMGTLEWYMGSNGGARYAGRFKCNAQREAEWELMYPMPGKGRLDACGACHKALPPGSAKLCTRCRSAVYCSTECQKAAWGRHKEGCGAYLAPAEWGYIDLGAQEYKKHWGRYPTAKPSTEELADDEKLAARERAYSRYSRRKPGWHDRLRLDDGPPPMSVLERLRSYAPGGAGQIEAAASFAAAADAVGPE